MCLVWEWGLRYLVTMCCTDAGCRSLPKDGWRLRVVLFKSSQFSYIHIHTSSFMFTVFTFELHPSFVSCDGFCIFPGYVLNVMLWASVSRVLLCLLRAAVCLTARETAEYLTVTFKYKVKVKCTLVHARRLCTGRTAQKGSRGIALLFHDQRH